MSYNIRHSDPGKPSIVVDDGDLNQETSLTFIGKNYNQSYSSIIGENFLHLLENFASTTPPTTPTEGQLWYNSVENNLDGGIKVFDGTNWIPLGVIKKGRGNPPPISPSLPFKNGDLYVDTVSQQLHILGDNAWTLIGPPSKAVDRTTAEVETIYDLGNEPRLVLTLFVKQKRVAIISDREFVPKTGIDGFTTIRQGITLSTTKFQTASKINKFWGTSEKAEALIVNDTTVNAINFLRADAVSTTSEGINVRNNNGLSIGTDLSFSIGIDANTNGPLIYNNKSGSNIIFRLKNNDQIKNVMVIDSRSNIPQRGCIGINNVAPDQTTSLDVVGNIKTNGSLIITGSNDSNVISPEIPALSIPNGGAKIAYSLSVGSNLSVTGTSTLNNNVTIKGQLTLEKTTGDLAVILPSSNNINNIGSPSFKFNTIYATNIEGNAISANSATRLTNGISLAMNSNDIQMSPVTIGTAETLSVTLAPNLNPQYVYEKPFPTAKALLNSDLILISRKANNDPDDNSQTLVKLTGAQLLTSFTKSIIQPGSVILWPNVSSIPPGYLLCDGRALPKQEYQDFYNIIGGTTFSDGGILKFIIPDLRNNVPAVGMNYIIYTGKT